MRDQGTGKSCVAKHLNGLRKYCARRNTNSRILNSTIDSRRNYVHIIGRNPLLTKTRTLNLRANNTNFFMKTEFLKCYMIV